MVPFSFLSHNPKLFFEIIEVDFKAEGVKSQFDKYRYLMKCLDGEQHQLIAYSRPDPHDVDAYDKFKRVLLEEFTPTVAENIHKLKALMTRQIYSDLRPRELYLWLLDVFKLDHRAPAMDQEVFQELFLCILPPDISLLVRIAPRNTKAMIELAERVTPHKSNIDQ